MKDTKAGTGTYLSVQCEIIEGGYKGRRVFDNINRTNPNPTAVEMGNQSLAAIMRATDRVNASDSADFHNIPLGITLGTREYNGELQNEIKAYFALSASTGGDGDGFAPATVAAGEEAAPW